MALTTLEGVPVEEEDEKEEEDDCMKLMNAGFGGGTAHDTDGFARAFAGAGVGLGALPAHGQAPQVTDAAIAFDALKTLEVHADLAAEIAFDDVFAFLNGMDDLRELLLAQVLGADVRVDVGAGQDIFGIAGADAINVAQSDFDALIGRNFYSDDASHGRI